MRIRSLPRVSRAVSSRLGLSLGTTLSALGFAWAIAAPASAWSTHGTIYTLKIVTGETTLPEYPIAGTSASVSVESGKRPQVAVSIVHNGITTITSQDQEGEWGAGFSQVPQQGETAVLESPVGHVIGSIVYDGMPTIDPTTCVGSANFEGENTSGYTVEGAYQLDSLVTPYHRLTEKLETDFQLAQVKSLTGTSFGGSFVQPIPSGATVSVTESLKTPLSSASSPQGETTFLYESEHVEPANKTCPTPPAPPPSTPLVTPLQGALVKLGRSTILGFLKSGWGDHVSINQAGTVTQDLYLRGGKLPASAASVGKHHRKMDVLLARGTVKASAAGTVSVRLKLTSAGRHHLRSARHVNGILLTTLRSADGQVDTLSPHSLTLTR